MESIVKHDSLEICGHGYGRKVQFLCIKFLLTDHANIFRDLISCIEALLHTVNGSYIALALHKSALLNKSL